MKDKPVFKYGEKKFTEDEIKVIIKYFGCHPKYIRKMGDSVTIDAFGIASDGGTYEKGLLDCRDELNPSLYIVNEDNKKKVPK